MVSIIVPLYNKESTIGRCLESIANQTYYDWECLIVDDGSTDNSAQIALSYVNSKITYYYKSNGGVSSARNYGVSLANGEFVLFLDADDYLSINAVQILISTMDKYSTDCACANFYIQKSNDLILFSNQKDGYVKQPFKQWYKKAFCPRTGVALFPTSVLLEYPFKENLSRYEDAESLFNIMRKYTFSYSSTPIMTYTDDSKGLSTICKNPERDFVFHMSFDNKSFWEKLILTRLLKGGLRGYPNQKKQLKSMYPNTWTLYALDDLISLFYKFSKILGRY